MTQRSRCNEEYHKSGVEVFDQIIEEFKFLKIDKKSFNSFHLHQNLGDAKN